MTSSLLQTHKRNKETVIQNARVNTAGAYVCLNGLYLFAIGIQPHNGHIPIVRLGGHREQQETGWQCAVREVYEEAHLDINPLPPPLTYLVDWDSMDSEIREIRWEQGVDQEPDPILVVSYYREAGVHLSLMYLAQAEGIPIPSSEVKGLLLLDKEDIHALCGEPVTLGQYLNRGGRALFSESFDTALVLEPFAQLRLLSEILRRQEKPEVG